MCNRSFNPGFAFYVIYFLFHEWMKLSCGSLWLSRLRFPALWHFWRSWGQLFFLALICAFLWLWPVALIRLNPSILLCVRLTYKNYSQSLATFLVVSELDSLKTGLRNSSSCIYREDFYVKGRIARVRKCFSSVSEPLMPWKSYCWACRFISPGVQTHRCANYCETRRLSSPVSGPCCCAQAVCVFNPQRCWERRVLLDQCPSGWGISLLGLLSAITCQPWTMKRALQCHLNVIQIFTDSQQRF